MDTELIKKLYREYRTKYESILEEYGENEGFIINGALWWDYYKQSISNMLNDINTGTLTEAKALEFYKKFGFGPKLYGRSFIESGIPKITQLFLFLSDPSIPADVKIKDLVEDPESENYVKGVGINFVTLFLTSYFPDDFVQWNIQTDGALKIIGVFPEKAWGEKKSSFYLKINDVCREIARITGAESLPIVDNFLYCLNKNYIGAEFSVEVIDTEDAVAEEVEEVADKQPDNSKHDEMMYYLIKIGLNKDYDVWVARNDKNKTYNNERFAESCLENIPEFTSRETLQIAQFIDVIWFRKGTAYPVRFFEIENTSSIYSGLLRFNDIKIDYPISKASIVIPEARKNKFEKEINRRTFKYSELFDVCDYLTYENLFEWYEATIVDSRFS